MATPAGDAADGPAQGRGRSALADGPDVETAVRTTGLLTAGRNRGAQTKTFSGEMMTDKLSLY